MAGEKVLGSMLVRIVGQNAEFDDSIDKSQNKLEKFGNAASNIGGNLTKFITLPIVGIGVAAVKSAADMEQAQLSFETLLGSGEKAKVLLGQLQKFAATTPFEFKDLAQGAKTLLAFGVDAQKILPITKQLGDIALGDSEKFKSLSLVFGQISSTGHLMGQDLLQLINVGFNPLQEIAKHTGESMDDLKKRMEKGKISAEEVAAAFKSATSEGGRFFEGTQKLGGSFTGLVSTLKDDATTLARGFGELVLPTLKDIVSAVSGIIQEFNNLDPSTKKFIVQLGLTVAAIGPVVAIVGKLSQALQFLGKNPIVLVITALVALTEAVIYLSQAEERQIEAWDKQIDTLKNLSAETEAILGPMDDLTKNNKLSIDQVSSLTKLYPELTNQIKLNNTTVAEANKLAEDAKKARAIQGFNETLIAISKAQAELDSQLAVNKRVLDVNLKPTDLQIKRADELQAKVNELKIQNAEFKKTIDEVNSSWFKGPYSKDAQVAAKQTEQDIFAIRAAEEKLLKQRLVANEGFKRINDDIYAGYIGQQMAIEETQRINQEATLEANAGFAQQSKDIAAGFAERSIAAKIDADNQAAEQQRIRDETAKTEAQTRQQIIDIASFSQQVLSAISNLITEIGKAQLEDLENQKQAALEAAGVAEQTEVEKAQVKVDEAKKSGDQVAIDEAENALKRAQINEEFEKKKAQLQYRTAHDAWAIQVVSTIASVAEAVAKGISALPVPPFPFAIAAGALGALQVASVVASEPKPPRLALGGIVMPQPGGVNAIVAEAGQPEAVVPLDRMNELIDTRGFGGGASQSSESFPVSLTIKLSERQLYKGIFQATRNRDVLIDASAVVNG